MERKLFIESQREIKEIIQHWMNKNKDTISKITCVDFFYNDDGTATAIIEYN